MDDRHWLFVSIPWDTQSFSPCILGAQLHLMVKKSELGYVKKRKRKKVVAVLTAFASLGVGAFVLVSFLGRFVGTFTVSLDAGSAKLSLSEQQSFDNSTSYIKIDSLPPFDLYSFPNLGGAEVVDNEETSYMMEPGVNRHTDGNISMNYFKYTFFIKNTGNVTVDYDLKVNLTKNVPSADGRYLDTLLRVMVYENEASSSEHSYHVYAKKSETPNLTYGLEEGEVTYKEYLSYDGSWEEDFGQRNSAGALIRDEVTGKVIMNDESLQKFLDKKFTGFAEMFESDSVIATLPMRNMQKDEAIRYTLVAWLEGEDQQAKGEPPEGGNLKLGVTINAYENQ